MFKDVTLICAMLVEVNVKEVQNRSDVLTVQLSLTPSMPGQQVQLSQVLMRNTKKLDVRLQRFDDANLILRNCL